MKFKKTATFLLSTSFLVACGNGEVTKNTVETQQSEIQKIEKHESVELPVTIFENSDYGKSYGKNMNFKRTINSVTVSDFKDEADEITFFDRYKNTFNNHDLDLVNDYKKVTIDMSHSFEGEDTRFSPLEAYTLDENTIFVVGDDELLANEFVNQQIVTSSIDYKMGTTIEQTGDIILAIPNEFVTEYLQLKTIKRQDDNVEVIYIDLQIEK